jgi:hypothetical protein
MVVVASGASNGSSNAATIGYGTFDDNGGTLGKAYNYRFKARASTGTPTLRVRTPIEWAGTDTEDFTLSTTMQTFEISAKVKNQVQNAYFGLLESGTFYIDDVELVPAGAVAEYDGSGITNDKWYDKSGNKLHGTVTGATDENTAGAPVISANHPAFQAKPSSQQANFALNSSVTVVFGTEVFDQDDNFATNNFVAPVTGKYQFNASVVLQNIDEAAAYYQLELTTSNRTIKRLFDPDFGQDGAWWTMSISVLTDMDVNDDAYVAIRQSAGTQQTDINDESYFSGHLVC